MRYCLGRIERAIMVEKWFCMNSLQVTTKGQCLLHIKYTHFRSKNNFCVRCMQ